MTAPKPIPIIDSQFRRQVERLHSLEVRATAEFLAELGAERSIRTLIDQKLATYAELDPKVIAAVVGAGFGPTPLHVNLRRRNEMNDNQ